MTHRLKNIINLLKYALIGGLCSFALGFLIIPFIPKTMEAGMYMDFTLRIFAIIGLGAAFFISKQYRFSMIAFLLGFLVLDKLFSGLFVFIDYVI